jgi:hypothetical protein
MEFRKDFACKYFGATLDEELKRREYIGEHIETVYRKLIVCSYIL